MNKKVIVISAVWCPSCLIIKKNIKKLQNEYDVKIEVLDYDFDEDKVLKYNVGKTLPVIISEKDNKEIGRRVGEKSYDEILAFLKGSDII